MVVAQSVPRVGTSPPSVPAPAGEKVLDMDHATIHPSSVDRTYRVDLRLLRSAPPNLDADRPLEVPVNGGHVVGRTAMADWVGLSTSRVGQTRERRRLS